MGQLKAKAKNKKGTMQNFIQNCIVPIYFISASLILIKASKALQRTV